MTLCQPRVVLYERKILVAAGVRLSFRTDSRTLFLRASLSQGTARSYFSFDLTVNGAHTGSLENFLSYPCPGITSNPPARWAGARNPLTLARALNAQELNKAIGGSVSFPEMVRMNDDFDPGYILVAYGTNDWGIGEGTGFAPRYRAMHQAIQDNYPRAQVLALTPIWRADAHPPRKMGAFSCVEEQIVSIAAGFSNVTVISGFDLVPHDESCFADLRLHPNDVGFDHHFNNLWPQIKSARKE